MRADSVRYNKVRLGKVGKGDIQDTNAKASLRVIALTMNEKHNTKNCSRKAAHSACSSVRERLPSSQSGDSTHVL